MLPEDAQMPPMPGDPEPKIIQVPLGPDDNVDPANASLGGKFDALNQAMAANPPQKSVSVDPRNSANQAATPAAGGAAPLSDDERKMHIAEEADRKARLTAAIEMGMRQFVSGVTQTPLVTQNVGAGPSAVTAAMESAKSRRQALVDALERKRRGEIDESTIKLHESEIRKNDRIPETKPLSSLQEAQTQHVKALTEDTLGRPAREAEKSRRLAQAIEAKRAATAKAEAGEAASSVIPFNRTDLGSYERVPGTKNNTTVDKEARDTVSRYGKAVGGIDDLQGAIKAYVAHPGLGTRNAMMAKVSGVAAAVTGAHGGGAMADSEFERQAKALGADPSSAAGMQAIIESMLGSPDAASAMLSKLSASRESLVKMSDGALTPFNYERKKKAAGPETKAVGGKTYEKRADGKWYPIQ